MANHQDPGVRTKIVQLLAIICSRLGETVYSNCTKSYHWYHLGNQISLHRADANLFTSIAQWVTCMSLPLDQLVTKSKLKFSQSFFFFKRYLQVNGNGARICEKCGLHSLIAILPQCVHDLNLTRNVFTFMNRLYGNETTNMRRLMIDIGILPSVIKSVTKFFSIWGISNVRALSSIQDLMITIGFKSMSSNGNISVSFV